MLLRLSRRFVDPVASRITRAVRLRRNQGRDFRPVFVTGAMGSGTSLTASLLAQSFECGAFVNESARQIRAGSPLHVDRTERYETIERYVAAISPSEAWTPELVRNELLTLYRSYADRACDVVIDKGPNTNMTRAPLLVRSFPKGRFVFVFRDPVANIEGLRRKWPTFRNDSLARSISFYRDLHESFLQWAASAPLAPEVVEYERLVEQPEATLARLGEALDLRRATSLRKLDDVGTERGGRGIRSVRDNRVEVVRGATERSVASLSPSEADAIRNELGPLHEQLRGMAARARGREGGAAGLNGE